MKYQTSSSATTKALGKKLAREVLSRGGQRRGATVVALTGDLGSGKTTFAQGFLRALGVRGPITSPTFILMRRHRIQRGGFTSAVHIDPYRLKNPRERAGIDFKGILKDPTNLAIIEWADRVEHLLPKHAVWITFEHGQKANERVVEIKK